MKNAIEIHDMYRDNPDFSYGDFYEESEVDELILKNDLHHGRLYDDLIKRNNDRLEQLKKELKDKYCIITLYDATCHPIKEYLCDKHTCRHCKVIDSVFAKYEEKK
jgi:hypothetical protein